MSRSCLIPARPVDKSPLALIIWRQGQQQHPENAMTMRAAHFLSAFSFALAVLTGPLIAPAVAQEERSVVRTQDADYFGFDLRFETDVTLDACEAVCLADNECRAFTYNTKAKRCFLKSDYGAPNPFVGAVAGRIVTDAAEPDLGAPAALSYVPDYMQLDARRYRAEIVKAEPEEGTGLATLASSGSEALAAGNAREAVDFYKAALAIDPDDAALWSGLGDALLGIETQNYSERAQLARDGGSSALNAYALARSVTPRAQSLAVLAKALDRRELSRPALTAYEASLALVNDAAVRAAYVDLKSRKGFRVLNHTVDADLAEPRVCVQFSEDLVKSGVDYASYVTVDEAAPGAISAGGRQICVEGLKHGEHYRIAVRQGLPAAIGEVTESPVSLSIYVSDRAPTIRFSGENFVLPSTGRHGLPMVSINAPTAKLKLHRIGDRSLASLLSGYNFLGQLSGYNMDLLDETGELVWEGEIDLGGELNKETLTSFPVDEALPQRKPGVYVLIASPEGDQSESWQGKATQWFVVSDIGLSTYAGQDGLTVFARSLSSAKPLANATLQLLARNNEILGEATTDARGRATFTPGLMRGASGLAPAGLTAKGPDGDFVFLDMTKAGFDLSDRGVAGRAAPGAVDVFAWTERGIYRAGETVHAAALARDDAAVAVENLPLTFIFTRPDGVEEVRTVSDGRALGGHHVPFALQPNAMLGTWALAIHTDPKAAAIARASFLVEQFVPDRIEFDLAIETPEIAIGETAGVSLDGRYLYGAPAAGLELEGEVSVGTRREWDRFAGYFFGLADEEVEAVTTPLALDPTDEDGHAEFEAASGSLPFTTRLYDGKVTVRMREGGGRAVERSASFAIRPETSMIGIRPDFAGTEVQENSTAGFRVIAVTPAGEREAINGARWTLTKIERNYQWYRSNNYWNYEAIESESRVADGLIDIGTADPATLSLPVEWGRYRLDVESADPAGPVASYAFNAGWFVQATSTETPDGLEIALDKDRYQPGDVARLKVSPRFAGELLVTVGAERLHTTLDASVPEGGTEIEIPVTADWGAGAYVTATLYRPGEAAESRMPARAIGVKWLAVEPEGRRLDVALGTPEKAEPRAALTVPVTLSGLASGEEAFVTIAAVDVGILNLTRYKAPDPSGWYFGQRRLGLELRDLYGRLIDGSAGAFGRIRTGGDGGGMAIEGNPPTEKLVAFFSGPVAVDAEGKAEVSFGIPEFNGTARIMTVAWSKTAVGQASADAALPRHGRPRGNPPRHPQCRRPVRRLCASHRDNRHGRPRLRRRAGQHRPRRRTAQGDHRAGDGRGDRRRDHCRLARPCRRRHDRAHALSAGAPAGDAADQPPHRQPRGGWRIAQDRRRPAGRQPARRRLGRGRCFPHRRFRRAFAAQRARPLSLWLFGADDEPCAAAALFRRAVGRLRHGAGPEPQGQDREGHRPHHDLRILVRLVRSVGPGLGRPVARRLHHRVPDPRPRGRLCRPGAGFHQRARQPPEPALLHHGSRGARHRDRLCALCAGAQPQGVDRRSALLCRCPDRRLHEPDGPRPACRQPRPLRRQRPRRKGVFVGTAPGAGDHRNQPVAFRLRLVAARRCSDTGARRRGPPRPGSRAGTCPLRRRGTRQEGLAEHPGAGVAGAGRARGRRIERDDPPRHRRHGA
jgi:tetratricopeptide (TPR) repeat protein